LRKSFSAVLTASGSSHSSLKISQNRLKARDELRVRATCGGENLMGTARAVRAAVDGTNID